MVAGVVVLLWLLYQARAVILVMLAALVVAVMLTGLASKLNQILPWDNSKGLYRACLAVVCLFILGIFVGLGFLIGPRVAEDVEQIEQSIPKAVEKLQELLIIGDLMQRDEGVISKETAASLWQGVSGKAMEVAQGFVMGVSWFVLVIFLSIFGAAQPDLYRRGMVSLFPPSQREAADGHLRACFRALWRWLTAQGFAMLVIAVLTMLGLWLVGMKFAITLGLIAGLLQFIPHLGPLLSSIPALLVALTVSPIMVLWVAIVYAVIQLLESDLITPMIMEGHADLPPVITLLSAVVGGLIFGPLGVVIAVPTAVLLLTLYQRLYQQELLGLDVPSPGD